ncbi:unnamed protein product [Dibothriocephalus latus]|uniref:Cytosol aminopeptidase domain-containing protein n=1 Tax=Dibothriocephalus latus TaxID=60516 RepID=A0A3P7M954_DIBLA|nr:unnamed protein product [Dibothriocephalus latus]
MRIKHELHSTQDLLTIIQCTGDSSLRHSIIVFVGNLHLAAVRMLAGLQRVERHDGRIVMMEYQGSSAPEETLLLAGKGITFDTGGANIKIGKFMQGMHRDKCGAAAVAGFFKTVSMLKPSSLKVMGFMAFVRNSAGADAYIPDEILTSLAGRRVRVVNTDAEGRVVLTDMLYYAKEAALNETNPHIFAIATLTGHARATYLEYSVSLPMLSYACFRVTS